MPCDEITFLGGCLFMKIGKTLVTVGGSVLLLSTLVPATMALNDNLLETKIQRYTFLTA